jgi:hypothetical protein
LSAVKVTTLTRLGRGSFKSEYPVGLDIVSLAPTLSTKGTLPVVNNPTVIAVIPSQVKELLGEALVVGARICTTATNFSLR